MLISSSVEPPPHVTPWVDASPEAAGLPQRLQVQQGEKIPKRGEKESEICSHVWLCFINDKSRHCNYCTGNVRGLLQYYFKTCGPNYKYDKYIHKIFVFAC